MSEAGLYGTAELETLVHGDSVLDGAFECLRRIWSRSDALTQRQLSRSEYRTRLLERHLARQEPALYDDLRARMGDHPLPDIDAGCGVVMDGLSVREGFQLAADLPEAHDWDVEFGWAAVERLPTETEFICRAWFDAAGPSAVNREDFRYVGDMEVPQLPGTDPEFVWTRFPDKRVEDAMRGNYVIEELTDIYADVQRLLERIITESVHEEFLVTSDHGYVNHHGGNPYALPGDLESVLGEKFSSRYAEVDSSYAFKQLEDAGIVERADGHYVIRGHYNPTTRGSSRKVRHGGLSLPECMTPVLRIDTTGDI